MENKYVHLLAMNLNLVPWQVENTLKLLQSKATIPFISRYRKEATGSLDEVQITEIRDLYNRFEELDKRRETILNSIHEQGLLTPELKEKLEHAFTMAELEDIYLPYKPKKKTRASVAREKGLEPLAQILLRQIERDLYEAAEKFLNDQVGDSEEALQGARDIIAEWVNEDQHARVLVRRLFSQGAVIASKLIKGKEEEGIKYKDYFDFSEPLNRCPFTSIAGHVQRRGRRFPEACLEPDMRKNG